MNKHVYSSVIFSAALLSATHCFAAKEIDLKHQPVSLLQTFISQPNLKASARTQQVTIKELSRRVDFNQTTHIRIQETVAGHPVWGSDAVIHIPKGNQVTTLKQLAAVNKPNTISMNGVMYQNINVDLAGTPAYVLNAEQADKALNAAKHSFQSASELRQDFSAPKNELMVYVDKKGKAHWAYFISFFAKALHHPLAKPAYMMDAATLTVYEQWNDLRTLDDVKGGGYGGNEGPVGKLIYDGLFNHFPKLNFQRDSANRVCYLKNSLTIVGDRRNKDAVPAFPCAKPDSEHNNVYWNTTIDAANGGYSPDNDVLYSDYIVRKMYMDWFKVQMLVKLDGTPMQVTMLVHDPDEGQNAYYYQGQMVFGEGDNESYPVVAPSVVAHEMSHGFTEQMSGLNYSSESGGLNEAFSDMADKAVEYYVYGKNNWEIDPELLKPGGRLLRWMDEPTKDCGTKQPGDYCSIDNYKDYYEKLDVHYSSGIFNKAFYLIATKWGDTKKAFEVMTQANMYYWTAYVRFNDAACGVIYATRDYKYDVDTVLDAMRQVGVDTSRC